jgi:hypothetical protein
MKKLSAILVGMSLVAGAVMAAGPVTSVNAVGYVQKSVVANQYVMMANPFSKMEAGATKVTIADVFGTNGIPYGFSVLLFDGTGYVGETFYGVYGWDPGTTDVSRADGFWVLSPATTNLTLSGEVPAASYASNTSYVIQQGYQMIGFPYPAEIALTNTSLATVAAYGDTVLVFNGIGYDGYTYYGSVYGWDPADLVLTPGSGYWYYKPSAGSTNWIETKPYNWP